jgi:signal transduction histidine kinase
MWWPINNRPPRGTLSRRLVRVQDASRLDRLLSKLPSNAIKFSPAGGPITIVPSKSNDDSGLP